jgi:hypothetical protein
MSPLDRTGLAIWVRAAGAIADVTPVRLYWGAAPKRTLRRSLPQPGLRGIIPDMSRDYPEIIAESQRTEPIRIALAE